MRKPVLAIGALAAVALAVLGTKIAIAGAADDPAVYEAEAASNTLAGGARVADCRACSGGKLVGWVGHGGVLTLTGVHADAAGPTPIVISYASGERRTAQLAVNGADPIALRFTSTGGFRKLGTVAVTVQLNAGANTLAFGNPTGWAPDFDKIRVGAPPAPVPSATDSPIPQPSPSEVTPPPPPQPSPSEVTPPPPPPTTGPPPGDDPVAKVLWLVNVERAKAGCPAIRKNDQLDTAARLHSADMAARGYFSHTTPPPESVTFDARVSKAGYAWRGAGENIAKGQRTPADVMDAWMNSPGHKANILNCGFRDLGVGLAYDSGMTAIWTQDFGTPA